MISSGRAAELQGHLAGSTQFRDRIAGGKKLHRNHAVVSEFAQLAKYALVIDFACARLVTTGDIRNVHHAHVLNVLFQLFNQVAFRYLLVKEIVEKLNLWMVYRFDYFERLGRGSQVVPGILLGIDRFKQKLHRSSSDLLSFDKSCGCFQSVDAALVLGLTSHARHHIAGEQNNAGAVDLLHRTEGSAEVREQR